MDIGKHRKEQLENEGWCYCPNCAGRGKVDNKWNPLTDTVICLMCGGTGKITWLDLAKGNVRYIK